jgi:hypothetical protein
MVKSVSMKYNNVIIYLSSVVTTLGTTFGLALGCHGGSPMSIKSSRHVARAGGRLGEIQGYS